MSSFFFVTVYFNFFQTVYIVHFMSRTTLSLPLSPIAHVTDTECTPCHDSEEQEPNSSPIITPKRSRSNRKRTHQLQQSLSSDKTSHHHRRRYRLLIAGYIRNVIRVGNYPVEMNSIIVSFYDEHIYWTIQGEEMARFRNTSNGRVMYGPDFELGPHIRFMLTLCPNGWNTNQHGSVQFYIELTRLPCNIEHIVIMYQLQNIETGAQCNKIRIFKHRTHSKIREDRCDAQSWGTNNLRVQECAAFDRLQFIASVKLLRVRFRQRPIEGQQPIKQLQSLVYIERVRMPQSIEFEWPIEGQLLHEFKHCEQGKLFYSPSFGNGAFCLEIAPNGWHASNRGRVMVYLRLLQLPAAIATAVCQCQFDSNQTTVFSPSTQRHTFCYDLHGLEWILDNASMLSLDAKECGKLVLYVKIQVLQIADCSGNGRAIANEKWPIYDLV